MWAVARAGSSTIPIVFIISGDPVSDGLVSGLARPTGNLTGISGLNAPLSGKRLQLLKEALPSIQSVGTLWNPDNMSDRAAWAEMQDAASKLGVRLQSFEARSTDTLDRILHAPMTEPPEALAATLTIITPAGRMAELIEFAASSRLPAIYMVREAVAAGGLMAYGPSWPAQFNRAAYYVDRILKGTKPADLPVEQPMTFEFVVNLKTAQALGITFPNEILLQVTEVLQ
jgi:putative tryptophan/tyrosine transport system substrate-binding protein